MSRQQQQEWGTPHQLKGRGRGLQLDRVDVLLRIVQRVPHATILAELLHGHKNTPRAGADLVSLLEPRKGCYRGWQREAVPTSS